jgi:hypothetical protein
MERRERKKKGKRPTMPAMLSMPEFFLPRMAIKWRPSLANCRLLFFSERHETEKRDIMGEYSEHTIARKKDRMTLEKVLPQLRRRRGKSKAACWHGFGRKPESFFSTQKALGHSDGVLHLMY